MSTVKSTYEELEQRVQEVEGLLDAMRTGKVDSVVSDRDASHLLVLREYGLELQKERVQVRFYVPKNEDFLTHNSC